MRLHQIVILTILAMTIVQPSGSVRAASFDCSDAGAIDEVIICQDGELSGWDDYLASIYRKLRRELEGSFAATLKQGQIAWLQQRANCQDDIDCIRRLYELRIVQLKQIRRVGVSSCRLTCFQRVSGIRSACTQQSVSDMGAMACQLRAFPNQIGECANQCVGLF